MQCSWRTSDDIRLQPNSLLSVLHDFLFYIRPVGTRGLPRTIRNKRRHILGLETEQEVLSEMQATNTEKDAQSEHNS